MISLTVRSTASTSAVSCVISSTSRSDSASIRSAVSGVRSRWERSATVSRSCASRSPIRAARRFSPLPARRTSGGPATVARAVRSPVASRSEAWARAAIGRTRDRASWSATTTLSASSPSPSPPSSSQARATPWRSTALGTKVRITAVPAGRPWTAARTSAPAGPTVVKLLAGRRPSCTVAVRGAGWPSSWPPGRKTVTGLLPFSAFTWSTVSRRVSVSSVADQGGQLLRLDGRLAHRLVRREAAQHQRERHQEGDQHQRAGRHHEQDDAESHPGALSLIPTPRTVCR